MQTQVNTLKTEIAQQEFRVAAAQEETNKSVATTFGTTFSAAAQELEEAEHQRMDAIKESINKFGVLQHQKVALDQP